MQLDISTVLFSHDWHNTSNGPHKGVRRFPLTQAVRTSSWLKISHMYLFEILTHMCILAHSAWVFHFFFYMGAPGCTMIKGGIGRDFGVCNFGRIRWFYPVNLGSKFDGLVCLQYRSDQMIPFVNFRFRVWWIDIMQTYCDKTQWWLIFGSMPIYKCCKFERRRNVQSYGLLIGGHPLLNKKRSTSKGILENLP